MADQRRRSSAPGIQEEGGRDPQAPTWTRNQNQGELPLAPSTPGGAMSPQKPGQSPDRSTIPGQARRVSPKVDRVVRPLTEAGTAQEIMGVYAAKPGAEMDPARFEQATATYEELRKAYPAQLPSQRPGPGWALETGDAHASEQQAIGGSSAMASLPMSAVSEVAQVRPGGGTAAHGEPLRRDAPAAEVGSAYDPSDAPREVRATEDATRDLTSGDGSLGTSSLGDAAPSPGDLTNPAGALSAGDGPAGGTAEAAGSAPTDEGR